MAPRYFTDLVVWKKSATIAERVHRITADVPRDEDTCLMCDMRESALAVSSAIARAHNSRPKGARKSLSVARGKLSRLEALCEIAESVDYVPAESVAPVRAEIHELRLMLTRMRDRMLEQQD
jgi:four helix bundle protein